VKRARAAALLAVLVAVAGCGSRPPDLFGVDRSGQGPNATLRLVVSDGGSATCNGREHSLDADRLLRAREITRELEDQARLHLELPPGPGGSSVLTYRVRLQAGTVAFSDTSAHLPASFTKLELLVKDISEDVCGIRR
jgi:hypothetical protein